MKISVIGLGYVGSVSAACFAKEGHRVVGVDTSKVKVELINRGRSPIIEKGVKEIVDAGVKRGRLRATTDIQEAIMASDLSLICVGTPSQLNGNLDLKYVLRVCEEIGHVLRKKDQFHVVAVRSTMLPGSMNNTVIPTLEGRSGKKSGIDFGVCLNPEFLREGTAVEDFYNPAKTVVGESDEDSGNILAGLYKSFNAPILRTDISTAEMVKYVDNVWHALKVCFANEIGDMCKAQKLDGREVMNIFCKDTKLNISPYYMKPGFAFGGSCLPKDVRALAYKAKNLDLVLPVLNAISDSNERQLERGLKMVLEKGNKKVGVLGFSFKAGTDDLRESPVVELIERLIGKGYDLRLYDKNVNLASIGGANKDYILNKIPHISRLMVDNIDCVLEHGDTLLIGNNSPDFIDISSKIRNDQSIVDLAHIEELGKHHGRYDGICW